MTRDPQLLDVPSLLAAPDENKRLPMADPSLSPPIKAPNAQSLRALAQAQDIIASRLTRFESVDALIYDLEKKQQQDSGLTNSSKSAVAHFKRNHFLQKI